MNAVKPFYVEFLRRGIVRGIDLDGLVPMSSAFFIYIQTARPDFVQM